MTVAPITPLTPGDPQARISAALDGMLRDTPPTPPTLAARPDPLVAAVRAALESAASSQGGLSQLFADLGQALRRSDLPAAARTAIADLLALRTPLHPALGADDIRRAVQTSGLFMEADLAAAPAGGRAAPPGSPAPPPTDIKAALLAVGHELEQWEPPEADAPRQEHPAVQPGAQPAVDGARAFIAPPPPYRGAPTAAQPPAEPSIAADAPAEALAGRLTAETRAAIARQELHQLASLPEARGAERPQESLGPRWLLEIPFATPQGAAIAQFEIAHDMAGGGAGEQVAPAWRVRFSLDVEPLGPVHAQVVLGADGRAAVTLWAERDACAEQLREQSSLLRLALQDAAFAAHVAVYSGAPHRPPPPAAGVLVDRSS
ncbi:MAG: flagellar hook-length control protein FliK [Phenylobacterium sp.]|uniref:flagellar hook-length control protein FliK n=1 Tax=Phenylobacterium sp. TaxID=1871053 RepID=UPI00273451D9|nr:flagellar hook-length control protein FliK [Phenylobacterium sp.]MDP3176152.1 flagellar hook-length control protein FliK [Phenylobacterium sp.]